MCANLTVGLRSSVSTLNFAIAYSCKLQWFPFLCSFSTPESVNFCDWGSSLLPCWGHRDWWHELPGLGLSEWLIQWGDWCAASRKEESTASHKEPYNVRTPFQVEWTLPAIVGVYPTWNPNLGTTQVSVRKCFNRYVSEVKTFPNAQKRSMIGTARGHNGHTNHLGAYGEAANDGIPNGKWKVDNNSVPCARKTKSGFSCSLPSRTCS